MKPGGIGRVCLKSRSAAQLNLCKSSSSGVGVACTVACIVYMYIWEVPKMRNTHPDCPVGEEGLCLWGPLDHESDKGRRI